MNTPTATTPAPSLTTPTTQRSQRFFPVTLPVAAFLRPSPTTTMMTATTVARTRAKARARAGLTLRGALDFSAVLGRARGAAAATPSLPMPLNRPTTPATCPPMPRKIRARAILVSTIPTPRTAATRLTVRSPTL